MQTVQNQAAPRRQSRKPSRAPLIVGGGFGALLCLLIAAGLAFLLLTPRTAQALDSTVFINTPPTGAYAAINQPLPIVSSAYNESGIRRIEVYADGALVAAQDSGDPPNPMIFTTQWIPLTLGRHVLVARAYPVSGGFVTSIVVPIDVVESLPLNQTITTDQPMKVNQIVSSLGTTPEALAEANPDLPTDPEADVPEGTVIEVPPAPPAPPPADPPAPPAPMPGAPAAPTGFTITADCTNANLSWTDAADETGYVVYRLDAPILTPIATLPANTTNYVDALPSLGTYQYQVASSKDGLESFTPLVAVSTPPECIPPLPPAVAINDLVLTLETLETVSGWDGVYCYFDINGTGYQRVPLTDFAYMTPDGSGVLYDLSTQLPDGGQYHVTADTSAGLNLVGECWGKLGPEVSLLGTFNETYLPDAWDGSDKTINAGNFTILLNIAETLVLEPLFPFPWLGWIDIIYGVLALPAPTDLAIGPSTAGCAEYSGFGALLCMLGSPQTVTWNWTPNTYHTEAQLTRYMVSMRAVDPLLATDTVVWSANVYRSAPGEEIRRAKVLPTDGLPCGSEIWVDVQAFKGTTASTVSSILWQTTPACGDMEIKVTFNTLTIETQAGFSEVIDLDSGDFCFLCTDTRQELFGHVGVNSAYFETRQTGGDFINPCPSNAWCIAPGTWDMGGFNTWPIEWDGAPLDLVITQPYTNDVTVWFGLYEVDGGVASYAASCGANMFFNGVTPAQWATAINGTYSITGASATGEEGQCTLNFTIEGVELP